MCLFPSTPRSKSGTCSKYENNVYIGVNKSNYISISPKKKTGKADATVKKEPCHQRVADDKAPVYLSNGELIQRAEVRHL